MRTVSKTVIGVDFGTQSARAVLVNAENGEIIYSCRKEYPYNSTPVPAIDCAENLPCATDYEMTLYELLRNVIPEEYRKTVAGICVDATSLTMVLLAEDGRALSKRSVLICISSSVARSRRRLMRLRIPSRSE